MVLQLLDCLVLIVLIYVKGQDRGALLDATNKLHQLIREMQDKMGSKVDMLLTKDFN